MKEFDRVTQQPDVMEGKACIRGMQVTVGMIVSQVGTGHSFEEITADYPYLERDDILQALRYAPWRATATLLLLWASERHGQGDVKLTGCRVSW